MDYLWQVLLRAAGNEDPLSCDDCFLLMDYLSDLLAAGHPQDEVMAVARKYLQRCPDCKDEYLQDMADLLLVQALPR